MTFILFTFTQGYLYQSTRDNKGYRLCFRKTMVRMATFCITCICCNGINGECRSFKHSFVSLHKWFLVVLKSFCYILSITGFNSLCFLIICMSVHQFLPFKYCIMCAQRPLLCMYLCALVRVYTNQFRHYFVVQCYKASPETPLILFI